MTPEEIVDTLLSDLDDRSGFSLGSIDDETKAEWRADWLRLVTRDDPGLTVRELVTESYGTAKDKGWHDEDGKMLSGAVIHIAKQAVGVLDVAATVEGIRAGKSPIYSHPEHILERLDALPPEMLRAVAWMVLVVTEVGESIEDILNEHMTAEVSLSGKPTGLGSELADIIIRVCDTAGALGIDLAAELRAKMDYNRTRSHKHGGRLA